MPQGFSDIKISVIDGVCSVYVGGILVGSYKAEELAEDPDIIKPVLGEFGIEKINIPLGLYLLDGRPIFIFKKSPTRVKEGQKRRATHMYHYYDLSCSLSETRIRESILIDTDYALKRLLRVNDEAQLTALLKTPEMIKSRLEKDLDRIDLVLNNIKTIEAERCVYLENGPNPAD